MSDFEEYIKNKNPEDYVVLSTMYANQAMSELYPDQFEVWQHQGAEIELLKAQLSLQRDRNKALEIELTSSRNYGDKLNERIRKVSWLLGNNGFERTIKNCLKILRGEHE
ncbi:hypothetical protein E0H80_06360 [Acinetobacter sp. ANC 4779]|uniref:hypothetical protein n=1 Tax=Acinetobacter sp. ANC 4779 TaxID=2529848 RepID=UPI001039BC3D|nr:hypothetical protein [Acinetobacter sp. ANC 4779]TCB50986.1 hypothetical protein E0H80_06360 [Acinetobacter sp. ANC 4779]